MPSSQHNNGSQQFDNLKKVYHFDDNDRSEAIRAVQHVASLAMRDARNESARSVIIDFGMMEPSFHGQRTHRLSSDLYSEQSYSSYVSRERPIFHGSIGSRYGDNESESVRSDDLMVEDRLSAFAEIKKRNKKKAGEATAYVRKSLAQLGNPVKNNPREAWMCGVTGKRFSSYEAASEHEDYHIREIVAELGWAQNGLEHDNSFGRADRDSEVFQTARENFASFEGSQREHLQLDEDFKTYEQASKASVANSGASPAPARPDFLAVSSRNLNHQFALSSSEIGPPPIGHRGILSNKNNPYQSDDFVVLADEALTDVCKKAEKLVLSQLEQEAEFELESYSKDKYYYDMLEQREIERQRDGAYSRFRTEGKNLAEKIQNKFVDAYAIMKKGKSKKATSAVDHYKRKIESDSDVKQKIENTKQTLYVNVIVKNSIQVVSHELDRLARQRWEEHKQKEGKLNDIRNDESRAQFEKFKARAQGQLVQLAGLALASDFTPRRIAVQLSNDLYRLLTPRLKRRGVFIESEIEYRVGPYFVLAVNVLGVDWSRLVEKTYVDVNERRAKWIRKAELDNANGVTRRYGPLASLIRLSHMTSMEVLAGFVATLYYTHWIVYTPICWFLYRFCIGETFRKYFLSSVTDEIFYIVEQKGMEMNIQIQDAESQTVCMLSALQEIRTDSRALKKKQEKAGSGEGEAELLGPLLGPAIKDDNRAAPGIPDGFEVPPNLEYVSLELNLQVGFQRLRWALLNSESSFMKDAVMKTELNYDK
ncbi:unnamed protein product [Pseudo-nitzschia multistriata]|uniref:Uncharacterized protein n=1 Tax=Pseudo-nitzschia multistriata TaxID=183589 RepID=A0A448YUT1_9STRA|nr:unnamed protein product [Pseudo-nitzschia multistriata]